MSDLVGNHIVGFPTRRLKYSGVACEMFHYKNSNALIRDVDVKKILLLERKRKRYNNNKKSRGILIPRKTMVPDYRGASNARNRAVSVFFCFICFPFL